MLVYILSSFHLKRNFKYKSVIGCYFFKHRIVVYDHMLHEGEYESSFLTECGIVWTDSYFGFNCK